MRGPVETSYEITIRPLTPLHVGSGDEALLGLDALYRRDGRLCIVDYEALPGDLASRLASKALQGLEALERELEALADNLPCRIITVAKARLPRGSTIRLPATDVVPGSTVKGYIRTAILYSLARHRSPVELRDMLAMGVNLRKVNQASMALEGMFFRAPRPERQGGFVDAFQQLLVSDPLSPPGGFEFGLDEIGVYKLPSLEKVASVNAIILRSGELRYHLSIMRPPALEARGFPREYYSRIMGVLSLLEQVDLLASLREFGCFNIKVEVEKVKNVRGLEAYAALLEEYRSRYCAENSRCVAARLGFMTGHHSKTILDLVKIVDPEFYKRVTSHLSRLYGRIWDDMTLKLVESLGAGLVGVGWCELCLREA